MSITAFILVVSGIFFGFALFFFNENANFAQAEDAVTKVANNANWVASLGEGSKVSFQVSLPPNVESFTLINKSVNLVLLGSPWNHDVYAYAKPNLTPVALPANARRLALSATFIDGNVLVSLVE